MKLLNMLTLVYMMSTSVCCFAFDDKTTHPKITENTIKISKLDQYVRSIGFNKGVETTLSGDIIESWLKTGSTNEDVPTCRAANHFHNPIKTWDKSQSTDFWLQDAICRADGWTPRHSNIFWATGLTSPTDTTVKPRVKQEMGWDKAREYFFDGLTSSEPATREALLAKSFQAVGQTLHLLQDMAVPAHVRNDFLSHLIYTGSIPWTDLLNLSAWAANPFEEYIQPG